MNARSIGALAVALCTASSAQALNSRTWVSGTGTDATGCGTIASPCRTLQFAHDQTAASGEINVKDAAGYGSIIVAKPISIINDGVGVAGVLAPSGGAAITIVAGSSGDVTLKGLTIEGAGAGTHGVQFSVGRNLTITDSHVSGFTVAGIGFYAPGQTTGTITATRLLSNEIGFAFEPSASQSATSRIQIHDVVASGNTQGFQVVSRLAAVNVAVSNTIASNNSGSGFVISQVSGYMTTILDGVTSNSNSVGGSPANLTGFGLYNYVGPSVAEAKLYIGRSTILGNNFGMYCSGNTNVLSFGNNQIVGNNLDIGCPLAAASLK